MRCPHCDKTITQNDKFCRHCGKPVVAPPPPAARRPSPGHVTIPIEDNDFGPAEILASHSGSTWGAHIYTGSSQHPHEVKARPEGCPEWVEKDDWHTWFRRGLVVWDLGARRIGAMLAGEAIELLKQIHWMDPLAAVMVLTGGESNSLKNYATEWGAADFFNKRVPLERLIKAVNVALKRGERESDARPGSGEQDRPVGLLQGPTSVMVVDDDPVIRELLADFLTQRGYRVLTAQDGAAALAVVDEKPPGLVVLDIYLPDMNGVAVLRELRARKYFGAVIVLSGSQEERLLKDMLGLGAVELIAKPFDLERLALAIQVGLILTNRPEPSLKPA